MQCPSCPHDNAADARFCSQCGSALERRCPSCDAGYEVDDRFCSHCGAGLPGTEESTPPAAPSTDLSRYIPSELLRKIRAAETGDGMRGERRTVTMLFADVQGSTAAAQHLDPEDWAEIMNGAFEHLIAPVYRFEGTLARLQGDAILAFFGAPIAHEDDPVRAARAGLEMLAAVEDYRGEVERRFGIAIGLRVGINTGLVVVGEVGSDLRVEYTALGDAINVAARMEQTAEPGTIRVTAETAALLGDGFQTEEIGQVEVKGRTNPVQTHRVIAFHGTAGARQARPRDTSALVGRVEELQRLRHVIDGTRNGIGGIAIVSGEAGIGKSRLLRAVQDDLGPDTIGHRAGAPGEVAWLAGRATAHESSVPHALFADLLADWWGPDRGTFDRIATTLAGATTDGSAPDAAGFLTAMVGGDMPAAQHQLIETLDAPVLHRRTTDAMADYFAAEAAQRPVVMVLDDLHWADASSLALVQRLIEVTADAPAALLLVTRPRRDDPVWRLVEVAAGEHADRTTVVELEPLTEEATATLLGTLLDDVEVEPDVRAEILLRAEGNPLFVEEIVRALGDHDRDASGRAATTRRVEVPASLSGLLTARLDQLPDEARHLAQVASVIGREFTLPTLAAAAGGSDDMAGRLDELLRRGILEEHGTEGEREYWFRHPLLHETAYSTMLRRTRRELHGRIAAHLAEHAPDRARQIATHWLEAGREAEAFPFLVEAGQVALRAMALSDAFSAFETAIEAAGDDADTELVLAAHRGLGEAHSLVPDLPGAAAAYQSLLDVGRTSDNAAMQVAALNSLAFSTAALAGRFEEATGYLEQARTLAEAADDEMGMAEYHMTSCFVSSLAGKPEAAAAHDEATIRIGEQAGNGLVRLTGLIRRASNLAAAGRYDEAGPAYDAARRAALEAEQEEVMATLECMVRAPLMLREGHLAAAVELLRGHLPTLDRYMSFYAGSSNLWSGQAESLRGNVEDALGAYASAERFGEMMGQAFAVAAGAAGHARVLAEAGMTTGLDALRVRAEEALQDGRADYYCSSSWTDLGHMELARGDVRAATELFETAIGSSSATRIWEMPRARFGLVRAALEHDHVAEARTQLELAREHVTAYGLRLREPEMLLLDGAMALREGRQADASTLLATSVDAASEAGARVTRVEGLRLLANVHHRSGESGEAAALSTRAGATEQQIIARIADPTLAASVRDRLARIPLART